LDKKIVEQIKKQRRKEREEMKARTIVESLYLVA
jgi:hypothetical protein